MFGFSEMGAVRRRRPSPALASDEELRGALPPRQIRSVAALQRIAVAARELFAARDYDSVSIADIAHAAGMSVGAFYTRFPGKEHLVVHLMGDLELELLELMDTTMNEHVLETSSVEQVVRQYLSMMAGAFVQHRGLIRPASLIARQNDDEQLQALLRRFNTVVHGRFREMLLARMTVVPQDVSAMRIDTAILFTSAAMREVLLYGEPVSSLSPRQAALVEELTQAFTVYLERPNAR
jgi:AcrR family transcriptional regulator